MKFTEHIELSDRDGQCLLTVRDTELHDFLDDFFTEHDIETDVVLPVEAAGQHQLVFPPSISTATVYRLLSQIGAAEIDRIASINSGTSRVVGGA